LPSVTNTQRSNDLGGVWELGSVEMRRTARKSGPGKSGMDPGVGGSGSRDRVVTVDLSLNAQSDRSPPSL